MKDGDTWPAEDVRLERLVDGELSPEEYRGLLASLDESPDGWRRCALAFLESQALARELRTFGDEAQSGSRQAVQPATRRRKSDMAWLALTAAASFLIAFCIGLSIRLPGYLAEGPERVAVEGTPPTSEQLSPRTRESGRTDDSVSTTASIAQPLDNLRLIIGRNDGQTEEMQLPVYQIDNDVARWFLENSTPVPAEIQQALRSLGYQVRRDRHWAPVSVRGSQQVLVPVDQVEITPVAGRSLQ